jgi:hypothetical protein
MSFLGLCCRLVPREKEPKDLHYLLMGLWALWTHLYCFGVFALGFDPKITQGFAIFF